MWSSTLSTWSSSSSSGCPGARWAEGRRAPGGAWARRQGRSASSARRPKDRSTQGAGLTNGAEAAEADGMRGGPVAEGRRTNSRKDGAPDRLRGSGRPGHLSGEGLGQRRDLPCRQAQPVALTDPLPHSPRELTHPVPCATRRLTRRGRCRASGRSQGWRLGVRCGGRSSPGLRGPSHVHGLCSSRGFAAARADSADTERMRHSFQDIPWHSPPQEQSCVPLTAWLFP